MTVVDSHDVKGYVGVTDSDWYRFLAERPGLSEVNFWRPSDTRRFGSVAEGEPFFFKSRSPYNKIIGGGFYSGFATLPLSQAWEYFGEANGAGSLEEMRSSVSKYRRAPILSSEDPVIGCVLIRDVMFLPSHLQMDPPKDWSPNLVQGKGYEMAKFDPEYFGELLNRILGKPIDFELDVVWRRDGPVLGDRRLAPYRLGQRSFQAVILDRYHKRCSITGGKILPTLQAAHILPIAKGGEHRADNGVLMRSDVHTMYDRGYLAIDPKYRLMVSPRLREEFGNGDYFYAAAGKEVVTPDSPHDRPNREFLERHVDEVFKAL